MRDQTINFQITKQTPYLLGHQTPLKMIINFTISFLGFDLFEEIIKLESPRSLPKTTELFGIIDYSASP